MTDPRRLIRVPVRVSMLPTSEGGRRSPVRSGFRPLCHFGSASAQPVGLCELELTGREQLEPGGSAEGVLQFDVVHRDLLRELVKPGVSIMLGDGPRIVGRAVVRQSGQSAAP